MIETEKTPEPQLRDVEIDNQIGSPGSGFQPLKLQPDFEARDADNYSLSDLLAYHDHAFVTNAYATITKREPTHAEISLTLDELRSGRRTKIEIIERLVVDHPLIHIKGLPSQLQRRMSQWPIVGYSLRLLRCVFRLPMLIRNQQQFEAYSLSQQQRIADYLNEVLAPAIKIEAGVSFPTRDLSTISDTVNMVMILSDSLVEMSEQHADLNAHLQNLHQQHENAEAQLHADLLTLTAKLTELQLRLEQSETRLHADLTTLTKELTAHQRQLDYLHRDLEETAAAQREFLIQEQRVIVETQQVAISQLKDQLFQLAREHPAPRREIVTDVNPPQSPEPRTASTKGEPQVTGKPDLT
jgi:hypothetical protein